MLCLGEKVYNEKSNKKEIRALGKNDSEITYGPLNVQINWNDTLQRSSREKKQIDRGEY
jgi:hypothetical protein